MAQIDLCGHFRRFVVALALLPQVTFDYNLLNMQAQKGKRYGHSRNFFWTPTIPPGMRLRWPAAEKKQNVWRSSWPSFPK